MTGPLATCTHVVGEEQAVQFRFHCRKHCRWFRSRGGWNQCDWRDTADPAMCGHRQAQVEALQALARATWQAVREMEADL